LETHSSFETHKKTGIMDWRPEAIRVPSIFVIVAGHMLFFTGYLLNDARNPLVWCGGLAIGAFMACSGYVHGLKDEFNRSGTLNRSNYIKYFKSRFLRLYIGYYLAVIVVFIAKLMAGFSVEFSTTGELVYGVSNPIYITPASLLLDITCMWPLFTANLGGIWPEGWFVCAILILSLAYPIFRRIYSINKNYLYAIMVIIIIVRLVVIVFINANYAYYFPFAWTAEFCLGMIIGNKVCRSGGPTPPSTPYQRLIISAAARVWPIYLFHMAAIVFMPEFAPIKDFFLTILVVVILTEIFYRILGIINRKLGVKQKLGVKPM